jgi:hypothetical protein
MKDVVVDCVCCQRLLVDRRLKCLSVSLSASLLQPGNITAASITSLHIGLAGSGISSRLCLALAKPVVRHLMLCTVVPNTHSNTPKSSNKSFSLISTATGSSVSAALILATQLLSGCASFAAILIRHCRFTAPVSVRLVRRSLLVTFASAFEHLLSPATVHSNTFIVKVSMRFDLIFQPFVILRTITPHLISLSLSLSFSPKTPVQNHF